MWGSLCIRMAFILGERMRGEGRSDGSIVLNEIL